MNAYASPYAAAPVHRLRDNREIEYDAFSKATAALKAAQGGDDLGAITHALHLNTTLWNTLLADLSTKENRMPSELRANLISLALFSTRHAFLVTSRKAEIGPLIDINLAMMRGLRGEV